MNDLHNNSRAQRVVPPVAVGTTGTGQTGKVIDRQGYGGVEFICGYGAVTATNAVFTVTVKEGDVTSSLTSVADADLLGTELLAGVGATASRVSGTSKNVVKRIGYKGLEALRERERQVHGHGRHARLDRGGPAQPDERAHGEPVRRSGIGRRAHPRRRRETRHPSW
jgi:hypothetical protein